MPRKFKTLGIICSIILHIIPFLFLIKLVDKTQVSAIPPGVVTNVRLIPIAEQGIQQEKKPKGDFTVYEKDEVVCEGKDSSYLGIGLLFQLGTGVVSFVPKQYPAYKAGIRVGDMMVDPWVTEVDGYMDIEVVRGYQHLKFHVKMDTICYSVD